MRVEAWTFAERVVEGLVDRYAAAEPVEAAGERDRRLTKLGARIPVARATDRRPS